MVAVLGFYSLNAIVKFNEYKNVIKPDLELTADRFHFFLKNEFKRDWMKLTAPDPLTDEQSPLKSFHITVDQVAMDSLNENLPVSGKDHFVDAYLKVSDDPEKIRKVKLRYRGDNNYHWLYKQKSLRIKLSNNDNYNMEKKFNLLNPPHWFSFRDILTYDISRKIGLISPDYFPVRVFINGQYMGVYIYLSQIDESLIRKHRLMPGSIYAGDFAPKNEQGVSDLWYKEKYWEKKAARNTEQKYNREDIKYFIKAINDFNDLQFYEFVNQMMDKNNLYLYMALDVLFATDHHDFHHNHKIYFDPYKGQFRQIEYDLRNWNAEAEKDLSNYPLLHRIKLNPILESERDTVIYTLLMSEYFDLDKLQQKYSAVNEMISDDLKADYFFDTAEHHWKLLKTNWISVPVSYHEYEERVQNELLILVKRKAHLINYYNNSHISFRITKLTNSEYEITYQVSGSSPIRLTLDSNIKPIKICKKLPAECQSVNDFGTLFPGKKILKNQQKKRSSYLLGNDLIQDAPLYYTFIIRTDENIHELLKHDISYVNNITGKIIMPVEGKFTVDDVADSIHPWELPSEKHKTEILEGLIHVNESLIFDKNTTVIIKPGTIFLLDANISIYFYGKVTALGTPAQPIKFLASDPDKPWGLVALQGKATTGSRFDYCEFENGSVDTRNLIHYTAPFNIHDMDWFEIRHCKMGKNHLGDDSMHIAYAKGIIDSCEFHDARSDGLDIDISEVNLSNNIFFKSGNDGLDVMTSKINASNNIFIDTEDKGISVGEWSEAIISNSFFLRTGIGLEIKDKSTVKADNLVFVEAKEKAINLYNKNQRYDEGGHLDADVIFLLGNSNVTADKRSSVGIKKQIINTLPELTQFQWYSVIQNTPYMKQLLGLETKYAE